MIDKDELKNSLTIEQIFDFIAEIGGEPKWINDEAFVSKTLCHNPIGEGSQKLYYYENTHLFRCFTECSDTFDIYQLMMKYKEVNTHMKWTLPQVIKYIANYFGFTFEIEEDGFGEILPDWQIFKNYQKLDEIKKPEQNITFKKLNPDLLKFYPRPHIESWEKDNIPYEISNARGICYDPVNHGIIIPHYDVDNNLIGIRERTLIKSNEDYGKYKPAILGGVMYNHPLGFNLYNLNNSKYNISKFKKAFLFEAEKSTMQYANYFGLENDLSVASCGSSLISHQVKLLLDAGCEELIIGYDKQFKEIGDEEWKGWTKKLQSMYTKYGAMIRISFLFDKKGLLGYKDAPTDRGKDAFMQLFEERIYLE